MKKSVEFKGSHWFKVGTVFLTRFISVAVQSTAMLLASTVASLESYGQFAYIFGLALIGSAITNFGGLGVLIRALPIAEAEGRSGDMSQIVTRVVSRSVLVFLILSSISVILLRSDLMGGGSLDSGGLILVLCLTFSQSGASIISTAIRQTHGANLYIGVREVMPWVVFLLVLVFFSCSKVIPNHEQLVILLSFSFMLSLAASVTLFYMYIARLPKCQLIAEKNLSAENYGWFSSSSIIAAFTANIDVVIARQFLGSESVGVYVILKRATSFIGLSQNIVNLMISRRVAELRVKKNACQLQRTVSRAFWVAFVPAFSLGLILLISSGVWFGWFKIPLRADMFVALILCVFAAEFNVFCGANVLVCSQLGHEKVVVTARVVSLVVVSISIWPLLAAFELPGLAVVFFLQAVTMNVTVSLFLYKNHGLWTSFPLTKLRNIYI